MKKLNIWLIKEGEALPVSAGEKLMRTGSLAKYLAEHGHRVTWWSSSFIHGEKKYISKYKIVNVQKNEKVVLLHSPIIYRKNVSLFRILYHWKLAKEFKKHSEEFETPDIIFCSWPTADFADAAIKYGERYKIPVVIDIRDYWPDIFVRAFPASVQYIAEILLLPMKMKASQIMKKAFSITGISEDAVLWGCKYAGRNPANRDHPFFIGSNKVNDAEDLRKNVPNDWKTKGIDASTWNICFLGSLRNSGLDLETVINAVLKLSQKYPDIRLGIAGEGDSRKRLEKLARDSKSVVFLGWQDEVGMNTLMSISKCGAYCIQNTEDFINTFSNKAIQYLSSGLPILNSLKGFAKNLLKDSGAGITYTEGDVSECANKIEELYLNEIERLEMASNALKLFNSKFDLEIINGQLEDYFYKIIRHYNKIRKA